MNKLVLTVLVLFITIGAYAQTINSGVSIAYIDLTDNNIVATGDNGGDGYYSRIRISSTGNVAFYYFQLENNRVVWAFTEIGSMNNLKDLGNSKYSYYVNGHQYIQGFMTLESGATVMWINNTEMSDDGISFVYEVD